jgi:hypothetical protein
MTVKDLDSGYCSERNGERVLFNISWGGGSTVHSACDEYELHIAT